MIQLTWNFLTLVALILSLFDTIILFSRGFIKKDEIRDLLSVIQFLASITPNSLDDEVAAKLKALLSEYGLPQEKH